MKLIKQMAIIFALCLAGDILSKFIPLPATILAMALMLILLGTKIIKVENIEEASGLIIGNMAMFFIPSNVSILENLGYMTGNILTKREKAVFELLVQNKTTKEIATILGISEKTVRNHVSNAMQKLGCKGRAGAVIELLKLGEISL